MWKISKEMGKEILKITFSNSMNLLLLQHGGSSNQKKLDVHKFLEALFLNSDPGQAVNLVDVLKFLAFYSLSVNKMWERGQVVVTHTFNPSTWVAHAGGSL